MGLVMLEVSLENMLFCDFVALVHPKQRWTEFLRKAVENKPMGQPLLRQRQGRKEDIFAGLCLQP
eukprot:1154999-Pelagomonas_calceolata.AAC.2